MAESAPDLLLGRLSELIEEQFGLEYPEPRWDDLARAIRLAAEELGFSDTAACLEWCLDPLRSRESLLALVPYLTIGETYFFRDPKAFAALETSILPAIIKKAQFGAKRLRIWSAGCCTGEEAYSVAIALDRAIPNLKEWQITILGTDVNPRFLQSAVDGRYGQWSFRGEFESLRANYFQEVSPGVFEVLPRIKDLVMFSCLNLVEDVYPALETNTTAMDVILCRNVLMYFSREQAKRVLSSLHHSLVEGGWLMASATEASPALLGGFKRTHFSGQSIFQKAANRLQVAKHAPPALPEKSSEPRKTDTLALLAAAATQSAPKPPPVDHGLLARKLADDGHLDEALAACDRALSINRLDPVNHYLRGVILQEQGALEQAESSLRRAIYLNPEFVVAHFAAGNLMLRFGRLRAAKRTFENLHRLLRSYSPETVLPESEGLTAGRLLEMIRSIQEANQ